MCEPVWHGGTSIQPIVLGAIVAAQLMLAKCALCSTVLCRELLVLSGGKDKQEIGEQSQKHLLRQPDSQGAQHKR